MKDILEGRLIVQAAMLLALVVIGFFVIRRERH